MHKVVLDTNILIALVLKDHIFHEEVRRKLNTASIEVCIPFHTLNEYVLVSKKLKLDDDFIRETIESFRESFYIVDTFLEDFFRVLELSKKYNIPLSEINDLILISIAKRLKAKLFTYDKELKKIAEKEGISLL